MRSVAVFDADFPPGVAFIRSLGRVGIPVTVFTSSRTASGRYSRHASRVEACPPIRRTDEFVDWLGGQIDSEAIELVAPTSDHVVFCVGEALEKLGRPDAEAGHAAAEGLRTCLFKNRFATAMERVGFPTPLTIAPRSLDEALDAAELIGYPVVVKPRTHVGIGRVRGLIAATVDDLVVGFRRYDLGTCQSTVLRHDPDLALPIVQRYHELGTADVVSVTGCLGPTGDVLALGHCRKVSQSPRRLGVGTMFEPVATQPFTDAAVEAVREVLGSGLFELEVLVDRASREVWALDLNPRAFGQISLDMALGRDLPALWYRSVTGEAIEPARARRRAPQYWHSAVSSYVGLVASLVRGPRREGTLRHALRRVVTPSVGAMFDLDDPVPGVLYGALHLRHPRAFVRPFLVDTELAETAVRDMSSGRSLVD